MVGAAHRVGEEVIDYSLNQLAQEPVEVSQVVLVS
jgi:hypothetical protein